MSRPVRVKDYLAAQVDELAGVESRSFANMVEVLLLAALTERGAESRSGGSQTPEVSAAVTAGRGTPRSVSADELAAEPVSAGSPGGGEKRSSAPESAADAVREAEDWLKARQDRPAKPYPKGGRR